MQLQIESSIQLITDKLQSWFDAFVSNLPNLGLAFIVLLVSYFLSKYIYKIVLKIISTRVEQPSLQRLVARAASVGIVVAALVLVLAILNLNQALTSMLTGAGVSGLVIGLALQGTLSNTFSGIVLSVRKNIQIGNWIKSNGYEGEVVDINLRNTVVKEADNNIVLIPNKMMVENPIKNFSTTTKTRITLLCGVGYESDLDKVERLTRETLASSFDKDDPESNIEFYYTEFGDSSINFMSRFWIEAQSGLEKLRAKSKAIIALKKAFDREDINIPFPIRTLQFDKPAVMNLTEAVEAKPSQN